jgi:hypothetical protein
MGVERADWEITVRAVLEHTSIGQLLERAAHSAAEELGLAA